MYIYEATDDGPPPPKPARQPKKATKFCIVHFPGYGLVQPTRNEMFLKNWRLKTIRYKEPGVLFAIHDEKRREEEASRRPARPASR